MKTTTITNKKILLLSLFLVVFCASLVIPMAVNVQSANAAVNTQDLLNGNAMNQTGLPQADLKITIMRIINIVLGLLGIIAIILIVYAGFLWMTSHGNEEKLKTAKGILINAVIGLAIILSALIIVSFILKALLGEGGGPPYQNCTPGTCTGCHYICNTEGTGSEYTPGCTDSCPLPPLSYFVVKWIDPKDGEKDIALCRAIQAGFNDELDENTVNANNILIKIKDGKKEEEICDLNKDCASGKCEANKCVGKTIDGTFITAKEVFQFRASKDFEANTAYQVEITTNVKSIKHIAINITDLKRKWIFTTGTLSDTTPPKVKQVYPEDNKVNVCLAAPIETIFNEPMDVISLMNKDALKINPVVGAGFNHNINNADTLIAHPNENYQKNKEYTPLLNSSIIADSCGNFLDGNGNGISEKTPLDDYAPPPFNNDPDWSFTTGTESYCRPEITNITSNGYYDGNIITISGNYFTIAGDAIFNNNVYSDSNCFDNDFYPNEVCVSKWEDKKIELKVPSGAGASNGAINGGVWVEVGEFLSNAKEFNVLSPHINWISPEKGGKEQFVTLSGANFGATKGKVYLVKQSDHKIKTEAEFPCENSWTDNQIIIKIPDVAVGEYYLQIKTNDNHYSNINNFIVNTDVFGPGICEAAPICGQIGAKVNISGKGFSTSGQAYFGETQATVFTSWNDTLIKELVAPNGIKAGGNPIKIIVNQKSSNAINFNSPCGGGDPCDTNILTPSCQPGACPINQTCNFNSCICQVNHCFNGQQDVDEKGIDCGGQDCKSCGNIGDSCDDNLITPTCQANDSICEINLICRPTDCTCQEKGQEGDPCDEYPATPACQANNGLCNNDFTCNSNNCKCTKKPFIDSISPIDGRVENPVTTYVTIRGGNFGATQGSSKVYFDNQETNLACQNWSDTEIIVATPFGFQENTVTKVKVKTSTDESNTKDFTVNKIIKPSICSLSPNHGKAGDKIIISGTNFGDSQINDTYKSQVLFENIEITTVSSWSNNKIEITVPNGITVRDPKVKIILKWASTPPTPNGTPSNEVSFYMDPFITSITPDKGPIKSYVTIRGGNFGAIQGLNKVTFNGVLANLAPCRDAWSDTEIIVLAPNSTTGPVAVEITLPNNDKIKSNEKDFTYNNEPLAPGICSVNPVEGDVGTPVTITGSEFGETQSVGEGVTFNGINANVKLTNPDNWTNFEIKTTVPQTTSGDVFVTKIGKRDTDKKECVSGLYIFPFCVGGELRPIMEDVVLKSNPVWFRVIEVTERYKKCSNNQCQEVDGVGVDECSNNNNCGANAQHKECSNNQCITVNGSGVNQCSENSNCSLNAQHKECSNNQCIIVNSSGVNQCTENNQCQLPPSVIETYPTGINICLNKEISVTFNHLMNKETLIGSNIYLIKGITVGEITTFNENNKIQGDIINRDENNKTTAIFSSTNNLEKSTEYKVIIKKGIKNRDGLTMEADVIWTFKTGTTLCQIDHIKIIINGDEGSNDLFICADDNNCSGDQNTITLGNQILGNQHKYIAQAQDKNNENISASYIWTKQDGNGILTTVDSKTANQIVTSQRKNGEAIVLVQADATGSPSKSALIKVESFMCENPWEIGESKEAILRDLETGFELLYCRDR